MADTLAMSFNTPNYSGMLFNKGNTKTPFSTLIGGRRKITNHVEFVTGQEFETATGTQPNISESASLTAPEASVITREQKTNVTQIFQESVGASYAKESNMGTLSGLNVAGQQANPVSELDFQVAAKMAKIAQDIEYTFLNGTYNKATSDTTVNKTRGLLTAITSNVIAAAGKPLTFLLLCELIKEITDSNGSADNLILGLDSVSRMQLNADAATNDLTIVGNSRNINGINIDTVLTPLGTIGIKDLKYLPSGTVVLFDPAVMSPVEQPVPGKGNFFMEELAKTGAGTKYQIFGQIGLDHGPEWYAGKITGLSTDMPADLIPTVKTVSPTSTSSLLANVATSITALSSIESTAKSDNSSLPSNLASTDWSLLFTTLISSAPSIT